MLLKLRVQHIYTIYPATSAATSAATSVATIVKYRCRPRLPLHGSSRQVPLHTQLPLTAVGFIGKLYAIISGFTRWYAVSRLSTLYQAASRVSTRYYALVRGITRKYVYNVHVGLTGRLQPDVLHTSVPVLC